MKKVLLGMQEITILACHHLENNWVLSFQDATTFTWLGSGLLALAHLNVVLFFVFFSPHTNFKRGNTSVRNIAIST